jgi:hypothetical protein
VWAGLWLPAAGSAYSFADGRVELHGFLQSTWRAISDDYQTDYWYASQWSNLLNLESDLQIAPNGWGPFELVSGFVRVEVRYECVYSGCGVLASHQHFGDRADRSPAPNWRDGRETGFTGVIPVPNDPPELIQGGHSTLLDILQTPQLEALAELNAINLDATFAPVAEDLFSFKKFDTSLAPGSISLGPWRPDSHVTPNGVLSGVPNMTFTTDRGSVVGLPLRPLVPDAATSPGTAQGIYVPSPALRVEQGDFDSLDLNFTQSDLEWNHGAGQDEEELKEAYLEAEAFDGRLWVRAGRQNIVWGKTELFRTTDQFNPQDIALSSLPSLEESRLSLWSARGVWSFYDVGPLADVRLELAANYDEFEPTDLGRCGEPYTAWLVCTKPLGAFGHGLLGIGLAGEERPPDPWDSTSGVEVGARLEWRWDRFSFALSDFWGYSDNPYLQSIYFYERNVDPSTGRPRTAGAEGPCTTGTEPSCLTPDNALDFHPQDRQYFDVICSATVGVAQGTEFAGLVGDTCLVAIPNQFPASITLAAFLAGRNVLNLPTGGYPLVRLNEDVGDAGGVQPQLATYLTVEQQALLGCGPFYATNCDVNGVDLFNAEGSVLVQSFVQVEADPPVATRVVDGQVVILPGALGPQDAGYDPAVDGCVAPAGTFPGDAACALSNDGAGANALVNPISGALLPNELAAVSFNFQMLLVGLDEAGEEDLPPEEQDCDPTQPATCPFQRAAVALTGVQRPELRAGGNGQFGRRDWIWQGGGEAVLRYDKRNVLGFSMDFAEDLTKTNWGLEFTWIDDAVFGSTSAESLNQASDSFNLTISMDRPTFVNFLNQNRTFFLNSQWFFGYTKDFNQRFVGDGPLNVLATFTVASGYHQDRLLPALTFVHDFRSASGAAIAQVGYRYTENFSVGFGAAIFYGGPQEAPVPFHQLAISNQGGDFRARTNYAGLSPIAERDELFVTLRYTF